MTGAVATVATTAAVAVLGQLENGNGLAAINAISHIVRGESASNVEVLDAQHTAIGIALNALAVTGWAAVHEAVLPRGSTPSVQRAVATGAAVSALAYLTDFHLVPDRFTPGFEEHLSQGALLGVYATLALALAAGSLLRERS